MRITTKWRVKPRANIGEVAIRVMARARVEIPRAVAQRFLDRLLTNWYGQKVALAPLSRRWLAKKRRLGWDQRILIATERLVSMMDVFPLADGRYLAGLNTTLKAHRIPGGPPSNLPLVELMQILEFGRGRIPPRPIFRLTLLAVEGELRRLARAEFRRITREEFSLARRQG
jgi:hypothetical protein